MLRVAQRNTLEYDYVGGASDDDAEELLDFTAEGRDEVIQRLKQNHPQLS